MAHKQKTIGEVHFHNREKEGVTSLFPIQLRSTVIGDGVDGLVSFLEDYYEFLNQKDQPTNIIDRITKEHDIDLIDDTYLNELKKEIAREIPNSDVLNNRQLFRNIVELYKARGSHDSIRIFFRLFFDDEVNVEYPSEKLFRTSYGRQSWVSYDNRLLDSDRWQNYSYVITSGISFDRWKQSYLKLIHPAGLKLFPDLIVETRALRTDRTIVPSFDTTKSNWVQDLYTGLSNHTPTHQPGWIEVI